MIDRYHLRYFLAVVDHGSFSRAATACNVTQPTLSSAIARIEDMLGQPLFTRSSRRVEITAAGNRLAAHARQIEARFATAERETREAPLPSTLRLGFLSTTPQVWIARFLGQGTDARHERVEIHEGRERDLHERLQSGRIDLALTILREGRKDLVGRPLLSEDYRLAVPANHALAGREIVEGDELRDETMIVRRNCEVLSQTSRYFTARGVRPFFAARTTNEGLAQTYVAQGLGITIMPESLADARIRLLQLAGFEQRRSIGLVFAAHVDVERLSRGATVAALAACIEG